MKDQTVRGELLQEKMRAALGAAGERLQAGAETAFRDAAADAANVTFRARGDALQAVATTLKRQWGDLDGIAAEASAADTGLRQVD